MNFIHWFPFHARSPSPLHRLSTELKLSSSTSCMLYVAIINPLSGPRVLVSIQPKHLIWERGLRDKKGTTPHFWISLFRRGGSSPFGGNWISVFLGWGWVWWVIIYIYESRGVWVLLDAASLIISGFPEGEWHVAVFDHVLDLSSHWRGTRRVVS